jgi:hypothetical protein
LVTLYGIFILIYAITPPFGSDIDQFLIGNIPLLDVIVRIVQLGSYEGTLIGWFAYLPLIVQVMLGIGIIIFGVIVLSFVVMKKESMRLQSLLKSGNSKPSFSPGEDMKANNKGDE